MNAGTPRAPDGGPVDRVVIVMLSALGDAVHVLPVATALKRFAPGVKLSWIIQPGPAALVSGHPAVDEFIIFERSRGWRGYLELRRRLQGRRFDVALTLQPYFKAGLITAMLDARVKIGVDFARSKDFNWLFTTHRLPPRPLGHIQDQFFEFLDVLGVSHGAPEWQLEPTAAEREQARAVIAGSGRPLVGLVVATSKARKNWPPERYAELASRLAASRGAAFVMLGAESTYERAAADLIRSGSGPAHLIDALGIGLRVTLGLLKECDVVVSPDTGPYHMCVAMGVPVVGLFGYTNPRRVGPRGRFSDLLVDAYGDPGEDYPISTRYRIGRMERITVEAVAGKVELALDRYQREW